jgi:type I restriction enzyme M protein
MPTKRDVLAQLTREELLTIIDRFALPVLDRRAREGLEGAVASSKKATLAEILPGYARDRLKELCRALGVALTPPRLTKREAAWCYVASKRSA